MATNSVRLGDIVFWYTSEADAPLPAIVTAVGGDGETISLNAFSPQTVNMYVRDGVVAHDTTPERLEFAINTYAGFWKPREKPDTRFKKKDPIEKAD